MSKELGTLIIVVLKAKNLKDKHSFYKQDVFAQVSLNGTTQRTPVELKGGQHPVWDAELRFPVMKDSSEKFRKLKVSCWAKESRTEDILGEGTIDIAETLKSGEFDDWVPLSTEAGGQRGDLYLEMTYYAAAPPPTSGHLAAPTGSNLTRRPSKLSPSDRLSRPDQFHSSSSTSAVNGRASQHLGYPQPASPTGHHLAPSSRHASHPSSGSSRSSSGSPRGRDSALPPLPEETGHPAGQPIPAMLLPGAGKKQSIQPSSSPQLPSILRPGGPKASSSTPVPQQAVPDWDPHASHPAGSPPYPYTVPNQGRVYTPAPGPVNTDYVTRPVSQAGAGYTSSTLPSYGAPAPFPGPDPWRVDAAVSFPLPEVTSVADPYNSVGSSFRESYHSSYQRPLSEILDPHRQIQPRYQTPLPLPPDAAPTQSQPPADKVEDDRVIALRLAEEEAARWKEQEEKDAELARQLDRELNL